MSTPEQALVLSEHNLRETVAGILQQLQQAGVSQYHISKASYHVKGEQLIAVVDWQFIDAQQQVFTDFVAIYHIVKDGEQDKIASVVSHDQANSAHSEHLITL